MSTTPPHYLVDEHFPEKAPAVGSPTAPAAAKVIQLDDHHPHLTLTTHANKVHVIPLSFFMGVAKGRLPIDNLGEHRDAILRVVLREWVSMMGLAEPEQLLTKDADKCPEDS